MTTSEDISNTFLKGLQEERKEVSIYLVNGIRLRGYVYKFDDNSILLRNGGIQLIRMNAISTIMPAPVANPPSPPPSPSTPLA